jgi:hypothetical protein
MLGINELRTCGRRQPIYVIPDLVIDSLFFSLVSSSLGNPLLWSIASPLIALLCRDIILSSSLSLLGRTNNIPQKRNRHSIKTNSKLNLDRTFEQNEPELDLGLAEGYKDTETRIRSWQLHCQDISDPDLR